jgi:peptidoglycan/xylan/chitin deacetylase (PgdA/CDA1 family)
MEATFHRLDTDNLVMLTFDDGTADHMRVGALLREHGLLGTFFLISGRIGKTGFLTASDVKRLASMGHRIASHTVTHPQLPSLSTARIIEELRDSKAALEDLTGRAVDWLAPPGGFLCLRSLTISMEVGYNVVRTMEWGYARLPLVGAVPCLPIFEHYSLQSFERVIDGSAMAWLFYAKHYLKKTLGEQLYVTCRDALFKKWTGA